jgi:hypothetical protein
MANGTAGRCPEHPGATFVDPIFLLGRDEHRAEAIAGQHRLKVAIGRPDGVYAMIAAKLPALRPADQFHHIATGDAPADVLRIRFQDEGVQSTFGQVERGRQPSDSCADDNGIPSIGGVHEISRVWMVTPHSATARSSNACGSSAAAGASTPEWS